MNPDVGDLAEQLVKRLNSKDIFLTQRYLEELPTQQAIQIKRVIKDFKYWHQDPVVKLILSGKDVEFANNQSTDDFIVTLDFPFEAEKYHRMLKKLVSLKGKAFIKTQPRDMDYGSPLQFEIGFEQQI